jgi:hypothetical protein
MPHQDQGRVNVERQETLIEIASDRVSVPRQRPRIAQAAACSIVGARSISVAQEVLDFRPSARVTAKAALK